MYPEVVKSMPDVSHRPEYLLSVNDIEITNLPHWVPHDLLLQIASKSEWKQELSILDEDFAKSIASGFHNSPWVKEVLSVKTSVPAKVQVELKYREPVGLVKVHQGTMYEGVYPVDVNGYLLPPEDFSSSDLNRYPIIENVSTLPQNGAGMSWGDLKVVAAARLAKEIQPYWKEFEFSSILVPDGQYDLESVRDLTLVIATKQGSRVVWGRPPGSGRQWELDVQKKIGKITEFKQSIGTLNDPQNPTEIDIRPWNEITYHPVDTDKQ